MKSPFRSIRQSLFNEGKLLRYLGYAIGEIALIIIGILFALKINNMNEDRMAQLEFEEYINQLKEDIGQAISVTANRKKTAEQRAEQAMTVLRGIQTPPVNEEEREAFETALDIVDQFHFAEIGLGHFGQVLNGNLVGIQDKNLSRQIMHISKPIVGRLSILKELTELHDMSRGSIVTYRGRPHPSYPEMLLAYDMDVLTNANEFKYLTQQFVYMYAQASRNYEETIEFLEDFLIILEEYE